MRKHITGLALAAIIYVAFSDAAIYDNTPLFDRRECQMNGLVIWRKFTVKSQKRCLIFR